MLGELSEADGGWRGEGVGVVQRVPEGDGRGAGGVGAVRGEREAVRAGAGGEAEGEQQGGGAAGVGDGEDGSALRPARQPLQEPALPAEGGQHIGEEQGQARQRAPRNLHQDRRQLPRKRQLPHQSQVLPPSPRNNLQHQGQGRLRVHPYPEEQGPGLQASGPS